ncbi:MAG: NAD(P)/FAD-dependent oxidoreductase [Lachnospiraceae bacterium]|nr:NAD(P)/FAD-dependent oxidoreductase [Lachnospiraceae bacterium]
MERRIAVLGGGAAGMMAAIAAAEAGARVVVFEKNEKSGKKLFITGKGRCNLTNSMDTADFFSQVVRNPRFLYSAVYSFDHDAVWDFFESRGLTLKEERGGRIFPASDHSSDVIRTLDQSLKKAGGELRLNSEVTDILPSGEGFELKIKQGGKLSAEKADAVIVACGGASYPSTGSDGKSFGLLRKLGHSLGCSLRPALVPLCCEEAEECAYLSGLSLKNVSLKLVKGKKKLYEGFGELLYTHFGLSGPLILSASSYLPEEAAECELLIDLKAALSEQQLDERILREFGDNKNKAFGTILRHFLPGKLADVFPERCGIDAAKQLNAVTKEERARFLHTLKELRYHITGTRGFAEAVITRGGVNVKEVDPSTMGSKTVPGLYIAGEALDCDALTGGFNLQIAWSTGYLAGISAAEYIKAL